MLLEKLKAVTVSHELVLLDLWATWCEPCVMLDGVLDDLQLLMPALTIVKADVDESPELKTEFTIMSVPVLILFHQGKMVWRMNGFMMAEELKRKITEVIS